MKKKDVIVYPGENLEIIDKESNFLSKATTPKKLETKVIKYETIGDPLEISSMSHIVFPFFTSRVKNRNVNLEYHFKDMGMKFFSVLDSEKDKDVKQPGGFEEKIYYFILQKSFEVYEVEKEKIEKKDQEDDIKEGLIKGILNSLEFSFNIPELLSHLGLKKNVVYYKKIEDALSNMKYTNYRFEKTNSSKYDKNFFDFESLKFSLINYEKLKDGRKTYYKVYPSNLILEKTFKNKQYLYFTSESRKDIANISSAALRVYRYISMKRFSRNEGEIPIESLAIIIPYELYSVNKSNGKEYTKSKINEVTKKIVKIFKGLKEEKYIKDFQEIVNEKDKPAIRYSFTEKLGIVTQYTNRQLKLSEKPASTVERVEEEGSLNVAEDFNGSLKDAILKAKRNIFASKAWNKRVDNKINKILNETNEEYVIYILKSLYSGLKQEITKTLVQYINGIMKNNTYKEFIEDQKAKKVSKGSDKKSAKKPVIRNVLERASNKSDVIEAEIVEESNKESIPNSTDDGIGNVLYDMFLKLNEEDQYLIRSNAIDLYLKETGSKTFTNIHEKIFKSLERSYIIKAIKEG